MRWRGRRQSSNVEDRRDGGGQTGFGRQAGKRGGGFRLPRGMGGGGIRRASGGGIKGIVVLVVLFFVLKSCGVDPLKILSGGGGSVLPTGQPQVQQRQPRNQAGNKPAKARDEMGQFVATILAETEDVWRGVFKASGKTYPEPKLVLFSGQVKSACGFASAASGPFYCPGDSKIYIDLTFFDELERKFGASGDFAQAYVLAHEVGHHVQNVVGVLPKFNQLRQRLSKIEANKMSVQVELQADCFAGIWGYFTDQKGLLERGDLDEALNAARQIGDDAIQKRTQGYVVPESFNHGTSKQRKFWFRRGFESGRLNQCNTFDAKSL